MSSESSKAFLQNGLSKGEYCGMKDAEKASQSVSSHVTDKGKDNAKALKMAMFLSVLSLVMTAMTLCSALLVLQQHRTSSDTQPNSNILADDRAPIVCLECYKLFPVDAGEPGMDPLLRKLDHRVENGEDMCCAYHSHQMSALMESVMRMNALPEARLPSYNVSDFNFSPVSAHKRVYPSSLSYDFGEMEFPNQPELLHFNESDKYGLEHHREVEILTTGLRVKHGGLYYIYSGVQFRPQTTHPCGTFKYKTFTHTLDLWSPRHMSSTLLKTTHSCCDSCRDGQESRFTAGLFIMNRGDVVQVKVTGLRLVHLEPTTSFVGLAMLGNTKDKN